jgi:hypothetical protein
MNRNFINQGFDLPQPVRDEDSFDDQDPQP